MAIREVVRSNGDWHVQSAGDLYLETKYADGNTGVVYVYGDLFVKGATTTIESNDLSIGDKVLNLNKGEPGLNGGLTPGVSLDGLSGVTISRGGPEDPSDNANLFFNQTKSWSYGGTTTNGMWEIFIGNPNGAVKRYSGITTAAIRTGSANTNLSVLGSENPNAVITVEGTNNYYLRVTDDDHIPNKKYVDVAIETQPNRRRLQLNYRNSANVFVTVPNTYLELIDNGVPNDPASPTSGPALEQQLRTSIGGNQWITTYNDRMVIGDIKILDSNEISMNTTNAKLVLSTAPAPGSTANPSVELKTSLSLVIDTIYDAPTSESANIKLYPKVEGPGGTGLYFVNSEGVRDEIPSKRRAFFASLMF